ncbi:MAG: hypothetical protein RL213_2236 [Bacteroidota bacterium]|jgi:uncharacterized protein YggU (UPF0235/DUF167 family)
MQLYVNVKPGRRFNRLEKAENGWVVSLRAPAVDGKANEALVEYLSEILGIPVSKIVLRKGRTSRLKCLEIPAEEGEITQRLLKAL